MSVAKPVHADQIHFAVDGAELLVGGLPLSRLAERVGSTPFYAYDRALLDARVAVLRAALPAPMRLHYSVKANPMPAVVRHMTGLVDGIDVASGGELRVALDAGQDPAAISFAGPGKSEAELMQSVAAGINIHVESRREIDAVARCGERLGLRPRVTVRINPPFELKASGMRMGGGAKPFGIDSEQVPGHLAQIEALGLEFHGFHIFSGSQSLKAEAIVECQSRSVDLALELSRHAPNAPQLLNIGGGFGIPYFPGEARLDLAPIADGLERCLERVNEALPEAALAIELGRYLVGEAGIYVARVIDRKVSRGQTFLITDGGMHHHLAASGNLGQVIRKNYPLAVGNRMDAAPGAPATVTGPLCTPLDILGENVALPDAQEGDLVVVFQSGAYGLSASPTGFLGHPAPREVLV